MELSNLLDIKVYHKATFSRQRGIGKGLEQIRIECISETIESSEQTHY